MSCLAWLRKRDVQAENVADDFAGFPLIVLIDNSDEVPSFRDFLWTAFTKSDPAADIHGIGEVTENKHWGCTGPLIIDAKRKPHHAPELVELPDIAKRANRIAEQICRSN